MRLNDITDFAQSIKQKYM